jgi:acyl carrier protein
MFDLTPKYFENVLQVAAEHTEAADVDLGAENAREVTVAQLALDSLEVLSFVMALEEVADLEMDNFELPVTATLWDIAEHMTALHSKNQAG